MMRIVAAAPTADLLAGAVPADDPTAASAFAAELDAITVDVDLPAVAPTSAAPALPGAKAADSPTSDPAALTPATTAALLTHPIVAVSADGPSRSDAEGSDVREVPDAPETTGARGDVTGALVEAEVPLLSSVAPEQPASPASRVVPGPDNALTAPAPPATPSDTPAHPETGAQGIVPAAPRTATAPDAARPASPLAAVAATPATPAAALPEAAPSAVPAAAETPAGERAPASSTPAVAVPVATPLVTTVVAAPVVAPATPVATSAPLVDQLRLPIANLRALPDGAHVVTVHVTPDELGPVTVRALVASGALDVQLLAPTDAGREALRALLPDLRRDLAQGGPTAQLTLGDTAADTTSDGAPTRERPTSAGTTTATPTERPDILSTSPVAPMRAGLATLDVLA